MDQVLPAVADLGRRHAGYGVRDEHYATVAAALLWTLDQGLGDAFTPDVRAAWIAMFETVTGVMRQGATAASAA
jgi:hemoglobin-like flavoprotein